MLEENLSADETNTGIRYRKDPKLWLLPLINAICNIPVAKSCCGC
jgi:hypothetical protein